MATDDTTLPPDDAFGLLGNETRMTILRALGAADGPLSFSELRDRAGVSDSGQFNYHLDKLTGHFIAQREAGYTLRQAGRRVVEAVLSGAMTEAPVVERTDVDTPCPHCGAPIAIRFVEERVEAYCTECPGTYEGSSRDTGAGVHEGYIGALHLPPAGLQDRSPAEILAASAGWATLEVLAGSTGMCPRCSAPMDLTLDVCEDHDASDGLCAACGGRHQLRVHQACTNCIFDISGAAAIVLRAEPALIAFQLDHGLNPIMPENVPRFLATMIDYDDAVVSMDPFEARLTFTLDDETLTLTVDGEMEVIESERGAASTAS